MIKINILIDSLPKLPYNEEAIKELAQSVLLSNNYNNVNLSIILSNRVYLNKLKKKYLDLDYYTDVIAFNLSDNNDCLEGEIYISIDDVKENAMIFKQSYNNELKRIIVHGVLHLIGYDDTSEKEIEIMKELENKYIDKFKENILE